MATRAPSPDVTFTKSELVRLAGIGDGIATFWLRNELIRPISGGGGRGNHRRFDRMQVSIAAILAEVQRFGFNVRGLYEFAEILQLGVEEASRFKIRPGLLWLAVQLSKQIDHFDLGNPITINLPSGGERLAKNHKEIADRWIVGEGVEPEFIIDIAKKINKENIQALLINIDILEEMDTDRCDEDAGCLIWREDDLWKFDLTLSTNNIFNAPSDIKSGIYLGLSAIIRKTWSIDINARKIEQEAARRRRIAKRRLEQGNKSLGFSKDIIGEDQ